MSEVITEIVERTFASPFAKILFDFIITGRRIVLTTIDDEIARDDRVRLPRPPSCRSLGRGVDRPRQAFAVEMNHFVFNKNGSGAKFEIVATRSRTPCTFAIETFDDEALP